MERLASWDRSVSSGLHGFTASSSVVQVVAKVLEVSGNGWFWLPLPCAALAAATEISPASRLLILNLVLALALDLVLVGTIKATCRRKRPSYNKGEHLIPVDKYSFPSGHASRACMVATLACLKLWTVSPVLCASLCIWAIATSYSRVLLGRHYFLDVFAGCTLGIAAALAVTTLLWVSQPDILMPFDAHVAYASGHLRRYEQNMPPWYHERMQVARSWADGARHELQQRLRSLATRVQMVSEHANMDVLKAPVDAHGHGGASDPITNLIEEKEL
eukprot:jgi/Chlat1/548/Chrsp103S01123